MVIHTNSDRTAVNVIWQDSVIRPGTQAAENLESFISYVQDLDPKIRYVMQLFLLDIAQGTANASIVSVQYSDAVQRGLVPGRFEYGQVLHPRDLPENSVVFGSDRRLVDGIAIAAGELLNKARGWRFEGGYGGQEDGGKGAGQEGAGQEGAGQEGAGQEGAGQEGAGQEGAAGDTGHRTDMEGEGVEYYRDYKDGANLTNNPVHYHKSKMHDFLISYVNRITDLYGDKAEGLPDLTRLCFYELDEIGTAVAEICGYFSQRLIKYVDLVLSPKEKKKLLSDADYKVFSGLYEGLKDWIYDGCPDECPVNLVLFDRLVSQGRRAKNPKAVYFDPRTQETSATIFEGIEYFAQRFGRGVSSNLEVRINTDYQLNRKYGSGGREHVSGMRSEERPVTKLVEEIKTLGISPGMATVINSNATTGERKKLYYRCKADGFHFLIPMMRLAGLYEGRGFKLFSPFPAGGRSLFQGRCVTVDLKILSRQVLHATFPRNTSPIHAWNRIADTSSRVFKPRNGLAFNGVVVFGRGMMRVTFDNSTKRGNQMATEDYRDTRKKHVDKTKKKEENRKKSSDDYFENNLDKLYGASHIVCFDLNRWNMLYGAGVSVSNLFETIGGSWTKVLISITNSFGIEFAEKSFEMLPLLVSPEGKRIKTAGYKNTKSGWKISSRRRLCSQKMRFLSTLDEQQILPRSWRGTGSKL
jgi:hypothetical protein